MSGWKLKAQYVSLSVQQRLHQCPVPMVAITGGLGSGKSSVMGILAMKAIPQLSADELVKAAYQTSAVQGLLHQLCPQVLKGTKIDFAQLRKVAFEQPGLLTELENQIYRELPGLFAASLKSKYPLAQVICYEIPLLFEKKLHQQVDLIATVVTSLEAQKNRAQLRDQSTKETIEKILARQGNLQEKAGQSHVVIDNHGQQDKLVAQVEKFLLHYFEQLT